MSSTIESVLHESRVFPPSPEFVRQANISGMDAYRALCAEAERDFEGFWARLAREELLWHKPFTKTLDESNAPFFKWFHDGELNASYNCLDRHLKTQPDKVAIIFEADDGKVTKITYKELYHEVCKFANALKAHGHQDRRPRARSTCRCRSRRWSRCRRARASARRTRWCSAASRRRACRSASSTPAPSRSSRADGQFRGGREIPLKPVVDEALAMGGCEAIKNVVRLQAHRQRRWR